MHRVRQDGAGALREAKNTTSTESEERVNCNVVEQDEERACQAEAARKGDGGGKEEFVTENGERDRERGKSNSET